MRKQLLRIVSTIMLTAGIALLVAPRALAAMFEVNTANDLDDGVCNALHCSLREAIHAANASPGMDVITFNLPGTAPYTIQPASALPAVNSSMVIDATTQPGYVDHPVVELDGSLVPAPATGLEITNDNSTVRGLAINRFSVGVFIGGVSNHLEGNFIGTDVLGQVDRGNTQSGVWVLNPGNTIGGASDAVRGAACLSPCNLISGNSGAGIALDESADNTVIRGNMIGTDVSGSFAIPNDGDGILIEGASDTVIGDMTGGNLISGNGTLAQAGISIASGFNTIVEGNRIGTNSAGDAAVPNRAYGIWIDSADTLLVSRNLISGNAVCGLLTHEGAVHMTLQGNLIGSDASGTTALANESCGATVAGGSGSLIGGTAAGQGNLFMGPGNAPDIGATGLTIWSTGGLPGEWVTVQGNTFRQNYTGILTHAVERVQIGGTAAGAGNVIVDNHGGIEIDHGIADVIIEGNLIGVEPDGTASGNFRFGIFLVGVGTRIGGTDPGAGNVIANSFGPGIHVLGNSMWWTKGNPFLGNSIYNNLGLAIDLSAVSPGWDGTTVNDVGDADDGANRLQNFPVLTSVESDGTLTTIAGSLNSTPGRRYRIEFFANPACDAGGYGELQAFLGATEVVTDSAGNVNFTASGLLPGTPGAVVAATATDLGASDTSEPSACAVVTAVPSLISARLVRIMRDIDELVAAGKLPKGPATSIKAPLQTAIKLVIQRKYAPAIIQMQTFDRKVEVAVSQGLLEQKLSVGLLDQSGQVQTLLQQHLQTGK